MNPLYFGASARPLFGVYHPPQGTGSLRGVLLCPAYASEYMRTHWAFRQLALRLTRAGLHVFRFDYSGTGDSAGERGQFDVDTWHNDIVAAAEELKSTAGVDEIAVVGLRLGALLAATCRALKAEQLILWDPVIDGRRYLDMLAGMHRRMLRDLDRFHRPRPIDDVNSSDQFLGFPFPAAARESISALSLKNGVQCDARRVVMISSDTETDNCGIATDPAHEQGNWNELQRIEQALFAPQTVRQIVGHLEVAA